MKSGEGCGRSGQGGFARQGTDGKMKSDLDDRQEIAGQLSHIGHKILVLSGKGGVGKSTVAANLALFLGEQGNKVGLLDIDIHGPSIPKLLGLENARAEGLEHKILPVSVGEHLKVMSIGFLLDRSDTAVIWRGPMKYGVIKQFLKDVRWGDLDYLIVDSPPGTGDEPLSVAQLIQDVDGAIIVTTPQELSLIDVRKCINFCEKLRVPVIGVIENMSGFVCPNCGERVDIFKAGGGAKMARELRVPYLGSIPIDPAIVVASDAGRPLAGEGEGPGAAAAFAQIARGVLDYRREKTAGLPGWAGGGAELTAKTPDSISATDHKEDQMRVAIPIVGGKLSPHFGHCEQFAIFGVDAANKQITGPETISSPAHEPGLLPKWLSEHEVNVIISGGMGSRAKRLFDEQNIDVIVGVSSDEPKALIEAYAAGVLTSGENICDH
ncbi:MAG TPA: iron-sulfur cluster carrier protein MrpORP [bacterium]|nr:iron-sulfur cluster carrier protein MrpORP [bacterium]